MKRLLQRPFAPIYLLLITLIILITPLAVSLEIPD